VIACRFYAEGVGDPTGETPFGLAAALQELLVGTQAVTEIISVFPGFGNGSSAAIPGSAAGEGACFYNLRVAGAFLISACFGNRSTAFVSVSSEAGRRCRLRLPSLQGAVAALPKSTPMTVSANGVVELTLAAGEGATVFPADEAAAPSAFTVRAMPMKGPAANFWGFKPRS
jgi:hypothetical protein